MILGLRVDVDTFRGTKYGVPKLLSILEEKGVKASFFFSVGPDNMGRHLVRLLKPHFLIKMLRSNAVGLYGWDIIFKGTVFPGPVIGKKLKGIIKDTHQKGHEIGLHAWDHHQWQTRIERMSGGQIYNILALGFDLLSDINGCPPTCSAAPGWKCSESALMQKEKFPFLYNSDCRGSSVFVPTVKGNSLNQPQIPVTLPTYDEIIGSNGITDNNYNEHLLSLVKPDQLNVLTIHAEAEGIKLSSLFEDFLSKAEKAGISVVPLSELLPKSGALLPSALINGVIAGREGTVALQKEIIRREKKRT